MIRALVPRAETYKYARICARSLRAGHARRKFSHYEEVPRELAEKVIAAARAEKEAGAHAS